jgi:hypothetical protein
VERSTAENLKTFAVEKNMQEVKFYVSTKQGHTGSRWREWRFAGSDRNNCSKFSSLLFGHPSLALQTADNHVSHYKETAIIGVSVLPHTFDTAQSPDISFTFFFFFGLLNLLTTENECYTWGSTHTK